MNSIRLHTRIDGPVGAPWLILSNSLGATLEMWEPQMQFLTQKFRVLRYDCRGHGQSDVPAGPYSLDQLVGDVIGLMDDNDIEHAAFMGLSKGGMTGLGLALDHSDRIDRVVCADARADAPDTFRQMWDQRIATIRAGGLEAILEATLANWVTPDWQEANPDGVSQIRDMVVSHNPEGYIACCMALKELDYLKRLGEVVIPVLYIGGDRDLGAPPQVMQTLADATPGAVYLPVENAAHVASTNRPEEFNAAIAPFFAL